MQSQLGKIIKNNSLAIISGKKVSLPTSIFIAKN